MKDNVKTNKARKFLSLILEKQFSPSSLCKIFNKNSVKVSYSGLPDIKSTIADKNKAKISDNTCNCRVKPNCPLNIKCLTSFLVYKAVITIKNTNESKVYIGMTAGTLKIATTIIRSLYAITSIEMWLNFRNMHGNLKRKVNHIISHGP